MCFGCAEEEVYKYEEQPLNLLSFIQSKEHTFMCHILTTSVRLCLFRFYIQSSWFLISKLPTFEVPSLNYQILHVNKEY